VIMSIPTQSIAYLTKFLVHSHPTPNMTHNTHTQHPTHGQHTTQCVSDHTVCSREQG
jgi:hypothetical protein